jgi:two-component system, OmpR family, sensor kinase
VESASSMSKTSRSQVEAEAETELQRLREELADAQAQLAELGAAVEMRDEFIAIAAHELRNPMSAIVLFVQSLRMASAKSPTERPPRLEEKLDALEKRVHHYVRRASLLLDVTRLNSGKYEMEPEPVDLSELTREVVAGLAEEFARANCSLDLSIEEAVVGLWDRTGLEQVLMNLLSNAVKYGAGKPIAVALRVRDNLAILDVQDAGLGISEDDQQRIFEKFERAVRRRQHGGFGMGLWISRQIVERLRGTIRVQSQPGVGSKFTLSLPLGNKELDI